MATWKDEGVFILRVLLGDNRPPGEQVYSDDSLVDSLLVAAIRLKRKADFSQDFTVSVTARTITPDPSSGDNRDESFLNLMTLAAACIAERGEVRQAVRQGIAIKDGSSSLDLRDMAKHRLTLMEKGYCKIFEEELLDYKAGSSRVAGAAVMGPFRAYAYGNVGWGRDCRREC